ncbi:hypothetical protein [Sphingomonas sp. PP-CE-1G-424]|uniref:hypothetical protein n=1 Tax=Sphingomonas sp. PP-CE-1G-424 TaxID=2135658 RepID=UPI001055AFC5|nr:hypothetical protein [Sphingomonas sp. PP-CE-1G-424]
MARRWRKCRPIIINTMHCRREVPAATHMRRCRQRERILGRIAINVASSFLLHANICHLYFILIGISIDLTKSNCVDKAKI